MGKLLAMLALAAIIVVALGFYLGWFEYSTQTQGDTVDVLVKVDKEKIRQDTDAAVQQGKKTLQSAKYQVQQGNNRKMARGMLKDVNQDTGMITISAQEGDLGVRVTKRTTLERNGMPITLNDLAAGQPVAVVYTTQENDRIAESVTVETK